AGGWPRRLPDNARNRAPLPEEKAEEETAHEHIRAPLDRGRDDFSPPALKSLPRHAAVRYGEEPEEEHIDGQRRKKRATYARVNRLGHQEVADEADGVEKGGKKGNIARHAVDESKSSAHAVTAVGAPH